jgi:sugar-phosphatase
LEDLIEVEKGILLDMDGTLADTLGVLYKAYCELLNEFGAIPTHSEFESLAGETIEQAISSLKSKHKIPIAETELISRHRVLYADKHMRCPPTPGALEFLQVANRKGIPCCLVTSAKS